MDHGLASAHTDAAACTTVHVTSHVGTPPPMNAFILTRDDDQYNLLVLNGELPMLTGLEASRIQG